MERENVYSKIFTCKVGSFPMKYLGLPIHKKRLLNKDWKSAKNKMEHKMGGWQGKLQSIGRIFWKENFLAGRPRYKKISLGTMAYNLFS